MATYLLHAVIFLPLVGAAVLMLLPKQERGLLCGFAIGVTLLDFLLSLGLFFAFDSTEAGMQLVTDIAWIDSLNIHYKVGIDGISLWLVLLTTFMTPITLLSALRSIDDRAKEFMASFLVLETAMIGTFAALDIFLFYVFWESMLIPMYLIIGVWGGRRRLYATVKFFLYTMAGSLLMLVAILYLYFKASAGTPLDVETLTSISQLLGSSEQHWLFGAFFLAFAIKVPMFPLHTWLPDAHTEAPTAGSVILAAVLLKMGAYGFIRFALPMFPAATVTFAPYIAVLSVIAIIYGAFMALAQHDVKRLIAYSSVSHLGFVTLGLIMGTNASVQGALLQMLNHGLSTGALFLAIGVLYERRHTRLIAEYGGLSRPMPRFAAVFMIATLSSIGLPGLNGFVGEFLVLLGTFQSDQIEWARGFAAVGATGVILGAVYMLWMFQRLMFGPVRNPKNKELPDLSARELVVFVPLVVMMIVIGVYPKLVLDPMAPAVNAFVTRYRADRAEARDMLALEEAREMGEDIAVVPTADETPTARPAIPARTAATVRGSPGTLRLPPRGSARPTGRPLPIVRTARPAARSAATAAPRTRVGVERVRTATPKPPGGAP